MIHNSGQQSGFTIIEALVAAAIFGLALSGTFAALGSNLRAAALVRNNFVASGLAQEGLEVVRNLRDSDWHTPRPFGSFGGTGVASDGSYRVQWDSASLLPFLDVALKFDAGNGLYGYDTGGNSVFRRRIEIVTVSAVEKKITVTVGWTERGSTKTLSAEDHLFDWR